MKIIICFLLQLVSLASFAKLEKPKLVIVLVVDQFRVDYLRRLENKFLPAEKNGVLGGFKFLLDNGAVFLNAQHQVAQNMTCPGHAAILTGSYPYANGISLNEWVDRNTGKKVYCAEDDVDKLSPRRLLGTTVGDELKLVSAKSRVVSVALKDRSAIMLGGKSADVALWLGKDLTWETSKYYSDNEKVFDWVETLNLGLKKIKETEIEWKSEFVTSSFSKKAIAGSSEAAGFPQTAEWTLDLAGKLVEKMSLGSTPKTTDILAAGISTHDIAGHRYGEDSPEMEDMTLREDRMISAFFNRLKKRVGIHNIVIAFTADHGVSATVEKAKSLKIDAGKINQLDMMNRLNKKIQEKFKFETAIINFQSLNFYLSNKIKPAQREEITAFAKSELLKEEGVLFVSTEAEVKDNRLPPGLIGQQIKRSFIPQLNGDLLITPKPFWYQGSSAANHVTGYSYDRSVPLILYGAQFKKKWFANEVHVVDLAPTLSYLLGTVAPALSEGRVLDEALVP